MNRTVAVGKRVEFAVTLFALLLSAPPSCSGEQCSGQDKQKPSSQQVATAPATQPVGENLTIARAYIEDDGSLVIHAIIRNPFERSIEVSPKHVADWLPVETRLTNSRTKDSYVIASAGFIDPILAFEGVYSQTLIIRAGETFEVVGRFRPSLFLHYYLRPPTEGMYAPDLVRLEGLPPPGRYDLTIEYGLRFRDPLAPGDEPRPNYLRVKRVRLEARYCCLEIPENIVIEKQKSIEQILEDCREQRKPER
jgi:hypothetical protein